jgi:iron complex outermembrane receptor protein
MKKFLGTMAFATVNLIAISQTQKTSITGKVIDAATKKPLAAASVFVNNQIIIADEQGHFSFSKNAKETISIKASSIGYSDAEQKISTSEKKITIVLELKSLDLFLQPLEVKSIRANASAPFAKTNISAAELAKINIGQDIPVLLNQTPSLYISSDAGNGVGYTYMHIRGSDATRINVTLNGIPYNDAESQGTYFVDLPDFSSSVGSIQIQRGVGTSANGTGAFGATINLSTNEFHEKAYAELNNSFGSFNTWKNTVKFGTGLIGKHFTIDGRFSSITSNGYVDRASSDLKSMALSAAYINKNSSLRFNFFSGKEKTYQAWYGIDSSTLRTDRTYNPAGTEKPGTPYSNETDNYWQNHYQLFFNHSFNSNWSFNTAFFLTFGKGYYEEYKADQLFSDYGMPVVGNDTTDLVRRRWLKNYFYGQIISLQYKKNNDELTLGGGWSVYDGKHFGDVIWTSKAPSVAGFEYYNYPALKSDANIYAKWQHQITLRWQSFIDLQYRYVKHNMDGFEDAASLSISRTFNFFNPKAGITYHYNGLQFYASYALGNKEPNRDDFKASLSSQPKAETLHDFEIGIEKKTNNFNWGVNVYYMLYKDQLVLTGKINDVGAYTRINTPNSYRIGLELQGGFVFAKWLNATTNLTFSKNKIKSFTEYIDNWDTWGQETVQHNNTDISFSPNIIGGATINILPVKNFELSLLSKYVSKQYLDNTQNEARSLKAFFTEDVRATYTIKNKLFKEWDIVGQVNNIFNHLYEPNGWTYAYYTGGVLYNQNGYYPMAGTNVMFAINIKL